MRWRAMQDNLPRRLREIADEMERSIRGKGGVSLHDLFAQACEGLRQAANEIDQHPTLHCVACGRWGKTEG